MILHPMIGLIGRKRSGKDTAAAYLTEHHGYTRVAFADNVRAMALAIDPIVGHVLADTRAPRWAVGALRRLWEPAVAPIRLSEIVESIGWERAKEIPEVRHLLQRVGTEAVRNIIGDDTWINLSMQQADKLAADGIPVVFTDVRFENEADAIRERGGILVTLVRDRSELPPDAHVSERLADSYRADVTVYNTGTLADLHAALAEIAWSFIGSFPRVP